MRVRSIQMPSHWVIASDAVDGDDADYQRTQDTVTDHTRAIDSNPWHQVSASGVREVPFVGQAEAL